MIPNGKERHESIENNMVYSNMVTDKQETITTPPYLVISENQRLQKKRKSIQPKRASIFEPPFEETEEERIQREEQENAERNEQSLIRILVNHNQKLAVNKNLSFNLDQMRQIPETTTENVASPPGSFVVPDRDFFSRDDFHRTTSLVSTGPGEVQVMSKQYKMVTSAVLWFCYFSLALNDYIFGPTFDDLSKILGVKFEKISYFTVYRQFAYTLGSLGGVGFNYVNRQLSLSILLLLSGGSLFLTPYAPSLAVFYLIAVVNGFAAGACDVGFHVWILEMFQSGGGPLLQALHFSFGIGISVAPLITSNFLSGESECNAESEKANVNVSNLIVQRYQLMDDEISTKRLTLFIPYAIIAAIVSFGGVILIALYFYKRYIPPKELKLPVSFDEQMPKEMTHQEKREVWRKSVPSFYIVLIITLGSLLLLAYYGLEVTYLQYLAQFSTATSLPISGSQSANLEAATGGAYALGGAIAIFASLRFHPERMIYFNFVLMNIGNIILVATENLTWFWIGNIFVGFGFSSCYATAYTFLEHQINVTNLIGSVFLFAGGLGTAVFPLFLSQICTKPMYLIYLSFFAANISLLLFAVMHFMTSIRGKQVKLIKEQLLKSPATLTHFKNRTLSALSAVSNLQ